MNSDIAIELQNVTKGFDAVTALNNISLQITRGSFTTLLGPSGCGKTTLMRLIAGFYEADAGEVFIHGKRMNGIPPHQRNTPMVFQDYALFPHMSVQRNIAYGLELLAKPGIEISAQVSSLVKMLGLTGLEDRFPKQLSGGQQQRVALARALAVSSSGIVLLDEPLSNLDAKLRVEVRVELRRLQQELDITNVYVTHDQDEALSMSDVIVVMRKGRIEQIGSPQEIYYHPQNQFVASFVGTANFIEAIITGITSQKVRLLAYNTTITINNSDYAVQLGEKVYLLVRPEAVKLDPVAAVSSNGLIGKIRMTSFLGAKTRYWIGNSDREYVVDDSDFPGDKSIGAEVLMRFDSSKIHLLKENQLEEVHGLG